MGLVTNYAERSSSLPLEFKKLSLSVLHLVELHTHLFRTLSHISTSHDWYCSRNVTGSFKKLALHVS